MGIEFDTTSFKILGFPPYIIMALIGSAFELIMYLFLQAKRNIDVRKSLIVIGIAFIGVGIGAKLLGVVVNIFNAIVEQEKLTLNTFIKSGIVFYGGLFGFISFFHLGYYIIFRKKPVGYDDVLAVIIPLFHFWGRIGCFFAGCCYGIKTNSFLAIRYTNRINGVITTANRFPSQLVEAMLNILLFIMLLCLFTKNKFKDKLLYVYLLSYAIIRFTLEFFRGDVHRGIYGVLSTSQYISCGILIYIIIRHIYHKKQLKIPITINDRNDL